MYFLKIYQYRCASCTCVSFFTRNQLLGNQKENTCSFCRSFTTFEYQQVIRYQLPRRSAASNYSHTCICSRSCYSHCCITMMTTYLRNWNLFQQSLPRARRLWLELHHRHARWKVIPECVDPHTGWKSASHLQVTSNAC